MKNYIWIILIPFLGITQSEKKLALVIGNANYQDPTAELKNPLNDAKLMSETFNALEFDSVIVVNDAGGDEMEDAFTNYKKAMRSDFNVGFIYYSGHGTQDDYNNSYLIPIDFPQDPTADDVEDYAYDFKYFIQSLERIDGKLHVIILDACRNNPFEKNRKGKSISGMGLAEPEETADGILIHFSTTAGKTASDNSDLDNSLYTKTLAEVMMIPNLDIESIFKETKKRVMEESEKMGSLQSPKSYGNWIGDLTLLWKKDYSKIEVKSLQKEAEEEKENGDIKSAIKKYNVLQNYFESSMQNIDKIKLIKVYIDLGEIYWQLTDSVATEKDYINNLTKSANSFSNAKLLLETGGISSKIDKENYSEIFYKYLRVNSYLNFEKGISVTGSIDQMGELIKYNEEHFGNKDYRTACSYYLSGLFYHDAENYLKAYKQFKKSSEIFDKAKYNYQDLENYSFSEITDLFALKWQITSMYEFLYVTSGWSNDQEDLDNYIINSILNPLKQIVHNDTDSILSYHTNIINKAIDKSKAKNNADMFGVLYAAERFYDQFPLTLNIVKQISPESFINSIYKSIDFQKKMSEFDGISNKIQLARKYNNIVYMLNKDESKIDEKIETQEMAYNVLEEGLNSSIKNTHNRDFILAASNMARHFYFELGDTENKTYTIDRLNSILNSINNYFDKWVHDYKKYDNPGDLDTYFSEYYYWMMPTLKSDYENEKMIINLHDQIIEKNMHDPNVGYGHVEMVNLYNNKASDLWSFNKISDAKKIYEENIYLIDNNIKSWLELYGEDKEEFIYRQYYYAYSNYLLACDTEEIWGDSYFTILEKLSVFIEKEKENLSSYNKNDFLSLYNSLKIEIVKSKIFSSWATDDIDPLISLCEDGINLIKTLKKKESQEEAIESLTRYETDFYYYLLQLTEGLEKYEEDFLSYAEKLLSLWDDDVDGKLDVYERISWHYFALENHKAKKKICRKGFNTGFSFLEKDNFPENQNEINDKLNLLVSTGGFLVMGTELACEPTKEDRLDCINFHKNIESFILENFILESDLRENAHILKSIYNTLADQSAWIDEYDQSLDYMLKNLELIQKHFITAGYDSLDLKYEEEKIYDNIISIINKTSEKTNLWEQYYNEYINRVDLLDSTINISCTKIEKKFNQCMVPFISIKIHSKNNIWPCIEFDIDKNNDISIADKRYFIDNNERLVAENIITIDDDIGGYWYLGVNESGEANNTTSDIFFDNQKSIYTNAYFKKNKSKDQNNIWEFIIPANELNLTESEDHLNVLVNFIYPNEATNTLSRRYNKHVYPIMGRYTGFQNSMKLKID